MKDYFGRVSPEDYIRKWPQYCLVLNDVYIGSGGSIFDQNGEIHPLANFNYSFWKNLYNEDFRPNNTVESFSYKQKVDLKEYKIQELPDQDNYIFAHHCHNIYVFGHIWDVFQDLQKIEELNLDDKKLIIPKETKHVNNLDEHLSLFGYDKSKRISLDLPTHWTKGFENNSCNVLYKISKLYYPSPTAYPSQISKRGLTYLRSKYYKLCTDYPDQTKLYLQRPKEDNRSVLNDKEVCAALEAKGFTIINGSESITEHVRLFRNASIIIGAHGSLFRNMIFSDQNPVVYEFCAHNREDHNFEGIGKTMNLNYNWIKCDADSNFNIKIDLSLIKNL